MKLSHSWDLTKKALAAWNNDNTFQLGAALAYYASFSISPLLVIALAVSSFFYSGDSFSYIHSEIASLVGDNAATAIAAAIASVRHSQHGLAATLFSVAMFLGAEFTKVYSEHHRFCVRPVRGALSVTGEARKRERGETDNLDQERTNKSA